MPDLCLFDVYSQTRKIRLTRKEQRTYKAQMYLGTQAPSMDDLKGRDECWLKVSPHLPIWLEKEKGQTHH